jgi:nucleoside diphosphate kinase
MHTSGIKLTIIKTNRVNRRLIAQIIGKFDRKKRMFLPEI